MIKLTITTDMENKEYLDSKIQLEQENSSFEEYITGIIAIIDTIRAKSPEISVDTLLVLIRQYYQDTNKKKKPHASIKKKTKH